MKNKTQSHTFYSYNRVSIGTIKQASIQKGLVTVSHNLSRKSMNI
jgi:hypothetical protein